VTGAWAKYLEHVTDKDLDKTIAAWERALPRYNTGSYPYESLKQALGEAYALREKRKNG
jgi:hypothetical protein